MWNCIGQQCHICLKAYEDEGQPNDTSYRKQILLACSIHLVSELGVDWNSISSDEYLPFCAQCLESIEGIIKYKDDSEKIQSDIKSCVQRFMMKTLRTRKQMKDKGVLLSWSNTGVKMEILEQQNCVACYKFYPNECQNQQLTFEAKKNILEQCKEHLYSDFITNSGGFDWNTIPEREIMPFCLNCFAMIDKISDLGNNFNNNETEFNEFLDAFLIQVFECRDALKKKTMINRNPNSVNNNNSHSVAAGKTTIVINSGRSVTESDDCYIVSASDEPKYSSGSSINESQGPRIVETTTLNRPEDVSSTNQSGVQSESTRAPGSLPSERVIHTSKQNPPKNAAVGPSQQASVTKSRIFIDKQLIINSVSSIVLPPGTSIEELPPSTSHESEIEAEDIEDETPVARKPRKKRRVRFSEGSKIRTRSRCGKCNRNFTYERNYVKHKETCTALGNYPNVPAKTTEPEVSFKEMPELQVEYSNYPDVQMETVTDSFSCTYPNCCKKFLTKENLQRHIAMHKADRPHQCGACGATFVQINHLKNHSRQKHCFVRETASTSTDWNFTHKKAKQNKTNTPSSPKKAFSFVCIYCGFNARNSTILSNHLQGHVEIADESRCTVCSHVCSNRHTLKLHVKRKHEKKGTDMPFEQVLQLINSDRTQETLATDSPNPSHGLWVKSGFVQSE